MDEITPENNENFKNTTSSEVTNPKSQIDPTLATLGGILGGSATLFGAMLGAMNKNNS